MLDCMSLWTGRLILEQVADLVATEVQNLLEGSFDPERMGGLSEQFQGFLVVNKSSNHCCRCAVRFKLVSVSTERAGVPARR